MTRYGIPREHILRFFFQISNANLNMFRSSDFGKLSFGHTSRHDKQDTKIKSQKAISERSNARFTGLIVTKAAIVSAETFVEVPITSRRRLKNGSSLTGKRK